MGLTLNSKMKKIELIISVVANLSLLGYFKYLNFFIDIFNKSVGKHVSELDIVLPIGISFFTFQGLSYVVDVCREKVEVQKKSVKNSIIYFYVSTISSRTNCKI